MPQLKYQGQHVFRTQRFVINPKKSELIQQSKEEPMNANAVSLINTLAADINRRAKEEEDQLKQLAELHPAEPPPVLLAKTGTHKEVDDWYARSETIKTNVNGIRGLESYQPPPVLLAEVTAEEKARINL